VFYIIIRKLAARWHFSRYKHWKKILDSVTYEDMSCLPARMSLGQFLRATTKTGYHMAKLKSLQQELNQ
jgi:hypothetical protein